MNKQNEMGEREKKTGEYKKSLNLNYQGMQLFASY